LKRKIGGQSGVVGKRRNLIGIPGTTCGE